jgi:hypothetical protein
MAGLVTFLGWLRGSLSDSFYIRLDLRHIGTLVCAHLLASQSPNKLIKTISRIV